MFKRLMKMKEDKKGFTLAELLIVVAIIGVLVAISVPIFTAQLHKATLATNQANARSAKAAAVSAYLEEPTILGGTYDTEDGKFTVVAAGGTAPSGTITLTTDPASWKVDNDDGKKIDTDEYKTISITLGDSTGADAGTVTKYGFTK